MLLSLPQVLPSRPQLLQLPHDPHRRHPLFPRLQLLACKLSGNPLRAKTFQDTAEIILLGAQEHRSSIKPISTSGLTTVVKENLHSLHPSVADVIPFLTALFEKDLSYSSLNTARSALSTIVTVDGVSIGRHPLVVRFLKGVFNLRPPVSRHKEVWDVSTASKFLKTFSPVASLSLKNLSLKVVMLLSLVTAQRGQTLHLLDISLMSTYDSSIVFTFSKPVKESNPRTQVKPLVLKAYTHDESLCVFSTLKQYLQRTKILRVTAGSQLLIGFQKPHKAVSQDTISRWDKNCHANVWN